MSGLKHILMVAAVVTAAAGSQAHADTPPPWIQCAYRHHPVAADLGALFPTNVAPPAPVQAVLLGEVAVGTDCSIYDLPV